MTLRNLRLLSLLLWLQRTRQRLAIRPLLTFDSSGLLWWSLKRDEPEKVSRAVVQALRKPNRNVGSYVQEPAFCVNYEAGEVVSAYLRFIGGDGHPVFRIYYDIGSIEHINSALSRCPDLETRLLMAEMLSQSVILV